MTNEKTYTKQEILNFLNDEIHLQEKVMEFCIDHAENDYDKKLFIRNGHTAILALTTTKDKFNRDF